MSDIVRAKVITNSSDDEFARVKISCPTLWDESPLVESVDGIPLKKDDIVFVDVSQGYDQPLILGRAMSSLATPSKNGNGSILFESSNGKEFTIAFVKNNILNIYSSDNVEITIDKGKVIVKAPSVEIESNTLFKGSIQSNGSCKPTGTGAFCGIKTCPFTGAPHVGSVIK